MTEGWLSHNSPDEGHDAGELALLLHGGHAHVTSTSIAVVDDVKLLGREVACGVM